LWVERTRGFGAQFLEKVYLEHILRRRASEAGLGLPRRPEAGPRGFESPGF
jgi:hypothetical protein